MPVPRLRSLPSAWKWAAGAAGVAALSAIALHRLSLPPLDLERVYRIGFNNASPFQIAGADGKPDGFAVEVVSEAARRRRVRLEWVFAAEGPLEAFSRGAIDLWPRLQMSLATDRSYVSAPWLRTN